MTPDDVAAIVDPAAEALYARFFAVVDAAGLDGTRRDALMAAIPCDQYTLRQLVGRGVTADDDDTAIVVGSDRPDSLIWTAAHFRALRADPARYNALRDQEDRRILGLAPLAVAGANALQTPHEGPLDLTVTDEIAETGRRVLALLVAGYDGPQITDMTGVDTGRCALALGYYAGRILLGTVPPPPSPECGERTHDGRCYVHGVFHPPTVATVVAAGVRLAAEQ